MRPWVSSVACIAIAIAIGITAPEAAAQSAQVKRGLYLVNIGGCNDCHTPGSFLGKRDGSRTLAGFDVGFAIPGMGVFVGPNLTPDKETGIGHWTNEQIVTAIRTGKRPDGACSRRSCPTTTLQPDERSCAGNRRLPQKPAGARQ